MYTIKAFIPPKTPHRDMQSTFMVNIARFPWMEDTAPVWRPLPGAACMRLVAGVHDMTEPE